MRLSLVDTLAGDQWAAKKAMAGFMPLVVAAAIGKTMILFSAIKKESSFPSLFITPLYQVRLSSLNAARACSTTLSFQASPTGVHLV